jgi:DNA (cytosine-5)-methyltransferase 1
VLTHLSLFSEIGGLDLAAEAAGFITVGQCEWADYPTKVLEKHWPDVPRWRDIRTLTGENFYARTGLRTVDVISGGFPCQPFSVAGKQKGKGDDRYLWPEMLRVIRELTPRCVVGENVPGILRIAAGDVVADLEREGYDVVVFNFEAAAVGAPHRRDRVAFVGYAKHDGSSGNEITGGDGTDRCRREKRTNAPIESAGAGRRVCDANVADAESEQRDRDEQSSQQAGRDGFTDCCETMADSMCNGSKTRAADQERREEGNTAEPIDSGADMADTVFVRRKESGYASQIRCYADEERAAFTEDRNVPRIRSGSEWWATEPDVGRVAHGIPNRVDRLKCLGNAVVPQQFYPIFKAIAEEQKR